MSRKSYTLAQKIDILKQVKTEFGGNLSLAARQLNIDRKNLRRWLKNENEMLNLDGKRDKRRRGNPGRKPVVPELEKSLFSWF